jgi:hypothetical protein
MNARATLLNGRTVKENGGGMVCVHFWGTSVFQYTFVVFTIIHIWWYVDCLNMTYFVDLITVIQ